MMFTQVNKAVYTNHPVWFVRVIFQSVLLDNLANCSCKLCEYGLYFV